MSTPTTSSRAPGGIANATFGVDYTRHAIVRHFNLGVARADRPATTSLRRGGDADQPVLRLRCPAAAPPSSSPQGHGGRSAGQLRVRPLPQATTGPGARSGDRVGEHADLILAHKLDTEALRILVPVATALIEERMASFAAALMAGVAAKYGGDPDHLDVVAATMPDAQEPGPAGAGGSSSCTTPCRAAPATCSGSPTRPSSATCSRRPAASSADCPCQDEAKRACHRCLLGHVSDDEFALVSRAEALEMLNDLLDDWDTESVPATGDISLWDQVESELEARFGQALKDWATGQPPPFCIVQAPAER